MSDINNEEKLDEETLDEEKNNAEILNEDTATDETGKENDTVEESEADEGEKSIEEDITSEKCTNDNEVQMDKEANTKKSPSDDKQKKKKEKKKDKRDEKIEELEDRVKRQMAEFENFRKRTEKEKSSMYEMGAKAVIEKILPVIDNFERGLESVPEDEADSPIAQGMQMIYKQLLTELENLGVKPIEALGTEFDANLHNAVMQVESEEYESGIIAQELQKGYTYRDSVVRHSMVAVAE